MDVGGFGFKAVPMETEMEEDMEKGTSSWQNKRNAGISAGLTIFWRLENIRDIYYFVSQTGSKEEPINQFTINCIIIQISV